MEKGTRCIDRFASKGERLVASSLVKAILKTGHTISVHDGIEVTVERSVGYHEVMEALATTGGDTLMVGKDGARMGCFCLVWSNDESGEELIADHSDNEYCHAVWNDVMARFD